MGKIIFMRMTEEVIHIVQGIGRRLNDNGGGGKVPFEYIQFGDQGIGENEIIVEEFAIRATRAIRDTPAQGLERAGQDRADAAGILQVDFVSMDMVPEAAGLDDGEEAPADLRFFLLRELDRDNAGGEGAVEHGPEAFAHAGGVDDDVLGMPGAGKGFEFTEDAEVVLADPTVAGDDMIGGALEGGESGEVDLEDGEGGGIAPGVAEAEVGGMERVEAGFVHAGDVEEEPHPRPLPKSYGFGEGRRRRWDWIGLEQGEAGGGEHAGLGVDGFAEELGADDGMVAAMFGEFTLHIGGVGGDEGKDILGSEAEEAPEAILFLRLQGDAALALEQGVGGPGGAPEDAGGVGAGGHGVEILVELGNADGLGLIDREQQVGGGAEDIGAAFAGEELQLGFAELVGVALGRFPLAARADTGVEGGFDALHVDLSLGFEGGRDGDDAATNQGIAKEGPGEEVRLQFVPAGLARQDDHVGEAEVMEDGVLDGMGDLDLVGAQVDAAGAGPGDGATTDGGADAFSGVRHFLTRRALRITKEHEGGRKTKGKKSKKKNRG